MERGARISRATAQISHSQRASPRRDDPHAPNESPAVAAKLVHALLPTAMAAGDGVLGLPLLRWHTYALANQPSWNIHSARLRMLSSRMGSARRDPRRHELVSRLRTPSAIDRRSARAYANPDSVGETGQLSARRDGGRQPEVL